MPKYQQRDYVSGENEKEIDLCPTVPQVLGPQVIDDHHKSADPAQSVQFLDTAHRGASVRFGCAALDLSRRWGKAFPERALNGRDKPLREIRAPVFTFSRIHLEVVDPGD
jgi:hypothetical protein